MEWSAVIVIPVIGESIHQNKNMHICLLVISAITIGYLIKLLSC